MISCQSGWRQQVEDRHHAMIDAKRLLTDLKRLRKRLEDDLRAHYADGPQQTVVRAEWQAALDARRTADGF